MSTFEWTNLFETGLVEIDDQHRQLIDLVNTLNTDSSAITLAQTDTALAALVEYAGYHFHYEESMMVAEGIPSDHYAHHQAEHHRFISQITAWLSYRKNGELIDIEHLFNFLSSWLVFHILGEDWRMAGKVKSLRAGIVVGSHEMENFFQDPRMAILLSAVQRLYGDLIKRNDDLRIANKSLLELNASLEDRVTERTAVLLNEQSELTNQAFQLISSQSKIQSLLNRAAEAIILFDPNGTVQSFNRAAERLFGCDEIHVLHRTIEHLLPVPADYAGSVTRWLRHYCASHDDGAMYRDPLIGQRTDGQLLQLHVAVSEVSTDDMTLFADDAVQTLPSGEFDMFLCILHDLRPELEARQLLEQQRAILEQANLQLARGSQAKDEFLAIVTHELRTPLNGILGIARLLREEGEEHRRLEQLTALEEAGRGLLGMIDEVLEFSRLAAEYGPGVVQTFDPNALLSQLVAQWRPKANAKGLSLTCQLDGSMPSTVQGNPGYLQRILHRLLDNGVKFTEHGQVVLSAEKLAYSPGGVRLRLAVADTGPGISADMQHYLFQAFTQGEASRTRRYGGIGIGLAMAAQLTRLMGGEIGVDSQLGKGSKFWLVLDLAVAEEENCIDLAALRTLQKELAGDFTSVAEVFLQDVAQWLEDVQRAVVKEDRKTLNQLALNLASHCRDMGVVSLEVLWRELAEETKNQEYFVTINKTILERVYQNTKNLCLAIDRLLRLD